MTALRQLGSEKYVLLTTFRKDGRAVATPVWVLPADSGVAIWTESKSFKVKRVRNDPRVTLAACDIRGNVRGETAEGRARIADDAEREHFAGVLGRKYKIAGLAGMLRYKLLGQRDRITVIRIDPA
ncbi:PPOX class F420-dependent oxidoreductase [Actinoplanes sp. LDG1-06]|uniref:PPOX class F420-dependent oxidoreductase n=1 Tax=Paractinoplanes ovalisporus TaxID=2810368 RepID=A0ABS2AA57_9ACTN|nr:PPOX class F420-dependent oxidoreductase [Actinoplanes ovalisporus]MBM2616725.1 PPOX class F420-dependent oxidoreductase [Actinoplanes ovalisporus]